MNKYDLMKAIGGIRDEALEKAEGKRRPLWIPITAAAACVAVILGIFLSLGNPGGIVDLPTPTSGGILEFPVPTSGENLQDPTVPYDLYLLSAPVYPKMAPFPDYDPHANYEQYELDIAAQRQDVAAQQQQLPSGIDSLSPFWDRSMAQMLGGKEGNTLISPMNIYFALSMLTETCSGSTRQQILDLLGAGDVEALREQAKGLWNANYMDDGVSKSLFANSLWLADGISYNSQAVEALSRYHYASAFQGEMGSTEYNAVLQKWINDHTGNLLQQQAQDLKFYPDTAFALASTVEFRGSWVDSFAKSATNSGVFHGLNGDTKAEYMHLTTKAYPVYDREQMQVVRIGMKDGYAMWILLPKDGFSTDHILESGVSQFLTNRKDYAISGDYILNLVIPKFDAVSSLELKDSLMELGVTDAFAPDRADFSPLVGNGEGSVYVDRVTHAARVKIDEDGCIGAAYTVIMVPNGAAPTDPPKQIDFVADHPFVFVVTGIGDVPLFSGVINQP